MYSVFKIKIITSKHVSQVPKKSYFYLKKLKIKITIFNKIDYLKFVNFTLFYTNQTNSRPSKGMEYMLTRQLVLVLDFGMNRENVSSPETRNARHRRDKQPPIVLYIIPFPFLATVLAVLSLISFTSIRRLAFHLACPCQYHWFWAGAGQNKVACCFLFVVVVLAGNNIFFFQVEKLGSAVLVIYRVFCCNIKFFIEYLHSFVTVLFSNKVTEEIYTIMFGGQGGRDNVLASFLSFQNILWSFLK